jgi:ADP-heptose:LPS heptosyltransferase
VKILAIRFARLGDVILLLPALASLKNRFPDSELTLLTGHRCAPIAELCPAIDHVISVNRVAMRDGSVWGALRDMAVLVRDIRQKRFDLVVDFHSFRETNLLTWLSGAPVRMGMKRYKAPYLKFCFNRPPVIEDKHLHVAEMFHKIVDGVSSASTWNGSHIGRTLGRLVVEKAKIPTLVLFVDAPVVERIWPPERFAQVADFAIEKLGAAVIVISSSQSPKLAKKVQNASRHAGSLSLFTDLALQQLASVIASAHLFISNDTGPMHIGPATGVPTLGLFSVGYPEHFRPTGGEGRYLRANPIEGIQVSEVTKAAEEMWATAGLDLRH